MKNIALNFVSVISGLILTVYIAYGQKGVEDGSKYGHGEDSIRCVKNYSLYREYAKHHDYVAALPFWKIVFAECPKISKNLYLDGVKLYRSFIEDEKDDNRKKEMIDTLMLIYDQRIKYFGQRGNVRGRQGVDLLRYLRTEDTEYVKKGYDYLAESIKLQGNKSSDPVLATFVSASLTLYKAGVFDDGKVIEDYLMVTDILNKKPDDKGLKQQIDINFVENGPGNCDKLIGYFTKEHETKSEDIDFLTMLTNMLKARECTESELYFTAAKDLYKLAPSAESALNIAWLAYNKEKYEEATKFYNEALHLEPDESKKADIYMGMALSYQKAGNKPASRQSALKAASARPGFGDPYLLIGQLYADSRDDCSEISLPNAVFWVAIDMFNKAKSVDSGLKEKANKLILTYSKYFPNKEEAFFLGINEGDSYKVECWINETTTARFN